MPAFVAKAAPRAGSSRKSMPMNCTGAWSACSPAQVFCRAGASATHGAHHEPHTLSTSTLPRAEAASQAVPSSSCALQLDRSPRLAAGMVSTAPSPET